MSDAYRPIDCGLHDRLQLLALRRRPVRLRLAGDGETLEAAIEDVFSRDGAEWIRLATGREIRLDRLAVVDGHPFQP